LNPASSSAVAGTASIVPCFAVVGIAEEVVAPWPSAGIVLSMLCGRCADATPVQSRTRTTVSEVTTETRCAARERLL
jgi:hypothetical protein